jgi:hypothetical protein
MARPASATRVVAALLATVALLLAAACSDDGSDDDASPSSTAATDGASGETDAAADGSDGEDADEPAEPTGDPADCPAGFAEGDLAAGRHDGFASGDQDRSFHLLLPEGEATEPRPLFVAVTGTVQEEAAFLEQSELDQLPGDGWIVVAPVRNQNGLVWGPWDAMRTPR